MKVALVALNWPDHRSLALGFVRAFAEHDARLAGRIGFITLDLDTTMDPWWVAYRIAALEPDVLGMSVKCWNAEKTYATCSFVKRILPGIHIVLGGPEVTPIAEEVLDDHPYVDTIVRGEGEETFVELLDALRRGGRPEYVDGVTTRHGGRIRSAPDRPLLRDLDSIPSPHLAGVVEPSERFTYIETYRGCPGRCAYCYEGKGYDTIRYFSPERVEAEIHAVASTPGVDTFSFIDPVFNITRERLEWFAGVLEPYARSGLRLHTVEVDIERIGPYEAGLLRTAGVASVETGPQSINPATLETCHRPFDADRFASGVEACKEAGISVQCDLIVGLPGDTADDIERGIRFLLDLDPGKVRLSSLHVLPGTELWSDAEEHGLVCNPAAPHEIIGTGQMDFRELRHVELLGSTLAAHYETRRGARAPGGSPAS